MTLFFFPSDWTTKVRADCHWGLFCLNIRPLPANCPESEHSPAGKRKRSVPHPIR